MGDFIRLLSQPLAPAEFVVLLLLMFPVHSPDYVTVSFTFKMSNILLVILKVIYLKIFIAPKTSMNLKLQWDICSLIFKLF